MKKIRSFTLVAYIPYVTNIHRKWFKKFPHAKLVLISNDDVRSLMPNLADDPLALPAPFVKGMLIDINRHQADTPSHVEIFTTNTHFSSMVILPDEEISHLFAKKFLKPLNVKYDFYNMALIHITAPA